MKKSVALACIFSLIILTAAIVCIKSGRHNEKNIYPDESGMPIETEESNIGVQVVHDGWGYTLKDFYFSETLPEGVSKEDCRDFSLPDLQPDSEGVERWVKAAPHLSDDGRYDGSFGLSYRWLIVNIDVQNLTGEANMERWGSHDLHIVSDGKVYPSGYSSGADWFSLHDNCGTVPDGYGGSIDYYCAYFEPGETRSVTFCWLIGDEFSGDGATRWIDLDVWGYSLSDQDKVGRLFLR